MLRRSNHILALIGCCIFLTACSVPASQAVDNRIRFSQGTTRRGRSACCALPEPSGSGLDARRRLLLVPARWSGRDDNAAAANCGGSPDMYPSCNQIQRSGLSPLHAMQLNAATCAYPDQRTFVGACDQGCLSRCRHPVAFFSWVKVRCHASLHLIVQIVYVRHHHSHTAGTRPAADRTWIRCSVDAKIRVTFTKIEIKCTRSQCVGRSWGYPVGVLCINLWLTLDHRTGGSPTWPLRLAPNRVGAWLVKSIATDGHAIARGRPIQLNVVEIPGDRINMDISRHQPRSGDHARRQKSRMQAPGICLS